MAPWPPRNGASTVYDGVRRPSDVEGSRRGQLNYRKVRRDISVVIATRYRLDGPGIEL
jgi:hypothetical protein